MFDPLADGWLVTDALGREQLFLRSEYERAMAHAVQCHGRIEPLYRKRYEAFPRHLERRKP